MSEYDKVSYNSRTGQTIGWKPGMTSWATLPVDHPDAVAAKKAFLTPKGSPEPPSQFESGVRELSVPGDPDKPFIKSMAAAGKAEAFDPATYIPPPFAQSFEDIRGQIDAGKAAWKAAKGGNYVEALAHLGRGMPVVGSLVGTLASNLGTAIDTKDYERFGGNLTALAGQAILGKLGDVIAPESGAGAAAAGKGAVAGAGAAEDLHFNTPAPTATGRVLEQTQVGRHVFQEARGQDFVKESGRRGAEHEADYSGAFDQHKTALKSDVQRLDQTIEDLAPFSDPHSTPRSAGEGAAIAFASRKAVAQAAFKQLDLETQPYWAINKTTGLREGPVQPRALKLQAQELIKDLNRKEVNSWTIDEDGNTVPEPVRTKLAGATSDLLKRLVNLQGKMTVEQAMNLRTEMGDLVRGEADVMPTRLGRFLTKLEMSLDSDVEGTLDAMARHKTIDPETLANYRDAKRAWTDLHTPFMRKFAQLAQQNPEQLSDLFWKPSTGVEQIRLMQRTLGPRAYSTLQLHALRNEVISKIVGNAVVKPDPHSAFAAGAGEVFPQISAGDAIRGLDKLNDPRFRSKLRDMVGPQTAEDVMASMRKQFTEIAGREAPKMDTDLPKESEIYDPHKHTTEGGLVPTLARYVLSPLSAVAGGLIGAIRTGLGGGLEGLVIGGVGTVALEYGLSRLMTEPRFKPMVGRLASAMRTGTEAAGRSMEVTALASALADKARQYAQEYEHGQKKKEEQFRKQRTPPPPPGKVLTPPPMTAGQ